MSVSKPNQMNQITASLIPQEGYFPNNPTLPLLIYHGVFTIDQLAASEVKGLLKENGWGDAWVNGIYDYPHYHSNTHEVLVIIAGWCEVIYGGPQGKLYKLAEGDVVIHPAGVSHKREKASENFSCVGAYTDGKSYDMCYGKAEEHPQVDINIKNVPLPKKDPVYGSEGVLFKYWHAQLD